MYEFYCHLWFLAILCHNGETKSIAQQNITAARGHKNMKMWPCSACGTPRPRYEVGRGVGHA
jgi:hypothetical protein